MIVYIIETVICVIFIIDSIITQNMFQAILSVSLFFTFLVTTVQQSNIVSLERRIKKLEKK